MTISNWLSLSLWASSALAAPSYTANKGYPTTPTVKVKNGTLAGSHSSQYNQDFFLGIPYAQPPVGQLRFAAPKPYDSKYDGTRDASQYPPTCVGYGSDNWPYPNFGEDCLYLNIVRPSGFEGKELPVGFWIHGGGLTEGSGGDARYNMSFIVNRSVEIGKPFIGVTINYRLSMWGFVTGDEVVKTGNANAGLRDQRMAMHWIKENIKAFGGNPKKVTIWGESAGALSVGMHLTAYNGRDDKIFRGAIMQSGNPINYGTFDYDKTDLLNASAQLGCNPSGPVLDCLRQIPFPKLNAWINSTQGLSMDWQPIIDGDFIQGKTSVQLAKGDFVHVPIIDGANSDEGSAFGPKPMNSTEQFINRLTHSAQPVILTPAQAAQVLKAYPQNATDYPPMNLPPSYVPGPGLGAESRRSDAYYGDVTMIAPRRKTCQTWAKAKVPAYCYRFNTIPHGVPSFVGATHFQEVAFVFDNTMGMGYGYPGVSQNPFEGEPEGYFELADAMSGAWASFIHDGMPGAFWPKYKVNTHPGDVGQNWVFDANVTGLGFVEEDSWRREGIQLIGEWDADVYHR